MPSQGFDKYPTVTVAVVLLNEYRFVRECLDSILNQDYPSELVEIIIVDGGSIDGTVQIVREYEKKHFNIKIIEAPGCSYPRGLNISLKQAKGEIWTFLDGHARVQKDYLSRSIINLFEMEAACSGGIIETASEGYVGKSISYILSSPFGAGNSKFRYSSKAGFVDTIPYGVYRKKNIDEIGYFNESFLRSADLDLNNRIRKRGGKFYLAPNIKTTYFSRKTLLGMMSQAYKNGFPLSRTIHAIRFRHAVPMIFVSSIIATIIAIPFFSSAIFLLLGIIGIYFFADILFSSIISIRTKIIFFPMLIITFPILHFSYGLGSLFGFILCPFRSIFPSKKCL